MHCSAWCRSATATGRTRGGTAWRRCTWCRRACRYADESWRSRQSRRSTLNQLSVWLACPSQTGSNIRRFAASGAGHGSRPMHLAIQWREDVSCFQSRLAGLLRSGLASVVRCQERRPNRDHHVGHHLGTCVACLPRRRERQHIAMRRNGSKAF